MNGMNQKHANMIKKAQDTAERALKRIDELEQRVAVLEAKRGPGRPPKVMQQ